MLINSFVKVFVLSFVIFVFLMVAFGQQLNIFLLSKDFAATVVISLPVITLKKTVGAILSKYTMFPHVVLVIFQVLRLNFAATLLTSPVLKLNMNTTAS